VTDDVYDRLDLYDFDVPTCPDCGEPMSRDEDGDGVMTMGYEFCEDCGNKSYGEPVELTEQLLAFKRQQEEQQARALEGRQIDVSDPPEDKPDAVRADPEAEQVAGG